MHLEHRICVKPLIVSIFASSIHLNLQNDPLSFILDDAFDDHFSYSVVGVYIFHSLQLSGVGMGPSSYRKQQELHLN